jgi:hypothetical protein
MRHVLSVGAAVALVISGRGRGMGGALNPMTTKATYKKN